MSTLNEAALRYGLGMQFFLRSPSELTEVMIFSIKVYAKHLKKSKLASNHSHALEIVAKACGKQHWHELQSVANELIAGSVNGTADLLSGAIPFMLGATPDVPPKPGLILAFKDVSERLAEQCHCDASIILDMIGRIHSEAGWSALLARRAVDTTRPLYEFVVDGDDGSGVFRSSPACDALILEQDKIFQGYEERSKAEKTQFAKWLADVLVRQPTFLEGYLAQGTVYEHSEGKESMAGACYDAAISMAEELIPPDFKGQISWYEMENRSFHRLLYAAMKWHALQGDISKSVALARKQLKFNKSDNLGVRQWLPILLARNGEVRYIEASLMGLGKPEDSEAADELVRCFAYDAIGNQKESIASLLRGLFMWPPLRWAVVGDVKRLSQSGDHRGVIPDVQLIWEQCWVYFAGNLSHVDFLGRVLSDRQVIDAEKMLAIKYHEGRGKPVDLWKLGPGEHPLELWKEECSKIAGELAAKLLECR